MKDIDMTAEEFFNGLFNLDFMSEEEKQTIYKGAELFAKGKINAASLNRQGWTRVEDGLPDDKQLCLVFNSISVEPSVYDRNEFYRYPNDVSGDRCALYHFDKSKVTHWMPLPNKPS